MKKNHYISGEFNVVCDVCSKKIKAHEAKTDWRGFIVCEPCYEVRHPQDFVRARQDKITIPFSRPIPAYVFTSVPYPIYVDSGYVVEGYILETVLI